MAKPLCPSRVLVEVSMGNSTAFYRIATAFYKIA